MANKISAEIDSNAVNAVLENLRSIEKYLPFLTDLTPEDRKTMLKLGDKSQIFVEKSLELALYDDSFLPRKFDLQEFKKDVDLYVNMFKIVQTASTMLKKLEDTYMLAGSEAYAGALAVYAAAKNGNRGGELETLVDELGKRFVKKQRAIKED